MSIQLKLWFTTNDGQVQLERVLFQHPLGGEARESFRGRNRQTHLSVGAFPWTAAVRAFAYLCIASKLLSLRGRQQQAVAALSGGRGSLACSLDAALGKCPLWVLDVFGIDQRGEALAKRLFRRTNPELKRPGPVTVSLAEADIVPQIFSEVGEVEDVTQLLDWSSILLDGESGHDTTSAITVTRPKVQPTFSWRSTLLKAFEEELFASLTTPALIGRAQTQQGMNNIVSHPTFQRFAGRMKAEEILHPVEQSSSASSRLGIVRRANVLRERLASHEGLRVCLPHAAVGSICIFNYLRTVHRLPIHLDWSYISGVDILSKVESSAALDCTHLFVVGIGQLAAFVGAKQHLRGECRPVMPLPSIGFKVVASPGTTSARDGFFLEPTGLPLSATFYLDDLRASGWLKAERLPVEQFTPADVPRLFAESPGARTILWFPNYLVDSLLHTCQIADPELPNVNRRENYLLMREDLSSDTELVSTLGAFLHDAWIELINNPLKRLEMVRMLLSDETYVRLLFRFAGVHEGGAIRATLYPPEETSVDGRTVNG